MWAVCASSAVLFPSGLCPAVAVAEPVPGAVMSVEPLPDRKSVV